MGARLSLARGILIKNTALKKNAKEHEKNDWQRRKLASDEDYRNDQAACKTEWLKHNTGYWKQYRKKNPEYAQRNREKQRERNIKQETAL